MVDQNVKPTSASHICMCVCWQ